MREKVEGRRGGGWQRESTDPSMQTPGTILLGVDPFPLFLFRQGEERGRCDGVSPLTLPYLCRNGCSSMTFSKNHKARQKTDGGQTRRSSDE